MRRVAWPPSAAAARERVRGVRCGSTRAILRRGTLRHREDALTRIVKGGEVGLRRPADAFPEEEAGDITVADVVAKLGGFEARHGEEEFAGRVARLDVRRAIEKAE